MKSEHKIYIIIVSYNAQRYIKNFLQNFSDLPDLWKVIIIDNNSSDNTVEIIGNLFPKFTLISNKENLGFGRGNNIGLSIAMKENADFVFLCNQDLDISPSAINDMANILSKNKEYIIASPIQLTFDGDDLADDFSVQELPKRCPHLYADALRKNLKDIYTTEYANAASWLMSRECIRNIGGFNPVFFMYGEDDEYIKRVSYHGFKLGIVPSAFARHVQGTKNKNVDPLVRLGMAINSVARPNRPRNMFHIINRTIKYVLNDLVHFNFSGLRNDILLFLKICKIISTIKKNRKKTLNIGPSFLD